MRANQDAGADVPQGYLEQINHLPRDAVLETTNGDANFIGGTEEESLRIG